MLISKIKLEEYLKTYGLMYEKDEIDFIKNHFEEGLKDTTYSCDMLRQIYSALSLLPKELDIYHGFLENIKKYFSLEQNILEIGSGYYPALARLIDLEQQKLGNGTITIYDDSLVTTRLGNIIINRSLYRSGSEKNNHSLIIGTAPCESSELIISESNRHKTDLYLALCGCVHSYYYTSLKSYHKYLLHLLESTLESKANITVDYLDSRYNYDYPILIKKKK